MSLREVLLSALRGVTANKLRTALTLLGVLIGVGSVIVLVGVGQASATAVAASLDTLGSNTLTVRGGQASSGATRSQALTTAVSDALAARGAVPSARAVVPEASTDTTVTGGGRSSTAQVVGTSADYFAVTNSPVALGNAFTDSDVASARKYAVIGTTLATELYDTTDAVGRQLTVGSTPLTVIGVLQAKDSSGPSDANSVVVAPISRVQQSLTGYGELSSVVVQARGAAQVDAAQAEVESVLDAQFKLTDPAQASYTVTNQAQLLATRTSTTQTFTSMLAAVAGISLLVGGIGVTNIMLVTVTERTREIGIRKALGATRGAVLGQFLVEATVLSAGGGVLGVLAAVIASRMTIMGTRPELVPGAVALALGVSVAIGVFFGGYPAWRASRLQPVQALRYE